MVERAAAAAVAGLDSLFVGDHHATGPVPYYQNSAVLGRLLAEWGDRLAPAAIDRAARLGDGWILAPWATDEQAGEMAAAYLKACEAHDRAPGAVVIRRDVHVGADEEDAFRVARPVLDGGYRGMDPAATVVGGPDDVARRFTRYAAMGYDHVLVRHLADGQDDVLASFARLAEVRRLVEPVLPSWVRRWPPGG